MQCGVFFSIVCFFTSNIIFLPGLEHVAAGLRWRVVAPSSDDQQSSVYRKRLNNSNKKKTPQLHSVAQ